MPNAKPSLWQRRFVQPIVAQFRQGLSAESIALTLAIAGTVGMFPLLGFTTFLCGFVAVKWKLNQGLMQFLCLCMYPVHLATLLPFYRAGEWLFQQPEQPLSIPIIIKAFFGDIPHFFQNYGMTGVRGVIVWGLISPMLGALIYFASRPPLTSWAERVRLRDSTAKPS
jgi:uncharacterized protein (DUF2062 family)